MLASVNISGTSGVQARHGRRVQLPACMVEAFRLGKWKRLTVRARMFLENIQPVNVERSNSRRREGSR